MRIAGESAEEGSRRALPASGLTGSVSSWGARGRHWPRREPPVGPKSHPARPAECPSLGPCPVTDPHFGSPFARRPGPERGPTPWQAGSSTTHRSYRQMLGALARRCVVTAKESRATARQPTPGRTRPGRAKVAAPSASAARFLEPTCSMNDTPSTSLQQAVSPSRDLSAKSGPTRPGPSPDGGISLRGTPALDPPQPRGRRNRSTPGPQPQRPPASAGARTELAGSAWNLAAGRSQKRKVGAQARPASVPRVPLVSRRVLCGGVVRVTGRLARALERRHAGCDVRADGRAVVVSRTRLRSAGRRL